MLEFIIVGTGRCGTGYMSRLVTSAGKSCGHESIFNPEFKGSLYKTYLAGDSSWLAVPYLHLVADTTKIIHIVRNPLNVFRSWFFDQNTVLSLAPSSTLSVYSNYLLRHYPNVVKQDTQIDKAIIYYIECNERIMKYERSILFKVEDKPNEILRYLGADPYVPFEYLSTSNTRNKHIATPQDVIPLLRKSSYYNKLIDLFLLFYPELETQYEF
jgi:hypothetical protein